MTLCRYVAYMQAHWEPLVELYPKVNTPSTPSSAAPAPAPRQRPGKGPKGAKQPTEREIALGELKQQYPTIPVPLRKILLDYRTGTAAHSPRHTLQLGVVGPPQKHVVVCT